MACAGSPAQGSPKEPRPGAPPGTGSRPHNARTRLPNRAQISSYAGRWCTGSRAGGFRQGNSSVLKNTQCPQVPAFCKMAIYGTHAAGHDSACVCCTARAVCHNNGACAVVR